MAAKVREILQQELVEVKARLKSAELLADPELFEQNKALQVSQM